MRRYFQIFESGLLFDSQKLYILSLWVCIVFMDGLDLSCICNFFTAVF